LFEKEILKSNLVPNQKAFAELISARLSKPLILTVDALHERGYFGFSWDTEDINLIGTDSNILVVQYEDDKRYDSAIDSEDDIVRMLRQALLIKEKRVFSKGKYDIDKVWHGLPTPSKHFFLT